MYGSSNLVGGKTDDITELEKYGLGGQVKLDICNVYKSNPYICFEE